MIRTARLLLRQPHLSDLEFVCDLFGRAQMVAHRPDPTPEDRETCTDRLLRDIGHWEQHGFGRWAVENDSELIGFGGVTVSEHFTGLNLSYHVHPAFWGAGYATEVAGAAVNYAFDTLGAQRVIGLAHPSNPASQRVLCRAGLRFERTTELRGAEVALFACSANVV